MTRLFAGVTVALAAVVTIGAQQIPASAHIVGAGNFIHAVADLDVSLAFYRDALGMETQTAPNAPPTPGPRPFIATPEILRLYDSVGGQYRVAATFVQGSPMRAELIEFKDLERSPAMRSLQDPGAGILVLTVRDLDAAFAQAQFKGATVVTETGSPVALTDEAGSARAVLIKDPDGFFVELIQRDTPPPATAPPGNVIDVGFAVTVDDMDRTVHVFRDVLGFPTALDPQDHDAARLVLMGVSTAFYRRTAATVPGSSLKVDFLEIHGLNRRHRKPRPRDPGSAILRLRVADLDRTVSALDAVDVKVVSTDGAPVTVVGANNTQRFAMTRTPDSFFVQVVQQVPAPAAAPRTN